MQMLIQGSFRKQIGEIYLYVVCQFGHMFDDIAVLLRLHLQELLNHHHRLCYH